MTLSVFWYGVKGALSPCGVQGQRSCVMSKKKEARIIDMIRSFLIACSFLTVLPVPRPDWTERNTRFFSLALPLVGFVLAAAWLAAFLLLSCWDVTPLLRGVLMGLVVLAVTGGLHRDGLMDSCDAIFSRRDRETRLRILSDPHSGAFAVTGCVAVSLLQSAVFAELFARPVGVTPLGLLAAIPVWSRLGLGLLLNALPFARDDGLARALGAARTPRHTAVLILGAGAFAAALAGLEGVRALVLPAVWLAVLLLWGRCCTRGFGGIAGDLLGAFAELSETAMLLALAALR